MAYSNADLSIVTRELLTKGRINQVYLKMPFIESLQERAQVITRGGKTIDKIVDTAEIDDLAQTYRLGSGDVLTDGEKEIKAQPSFGWKAATLSLRYGSDVEIMNTFAGSKEQLVAFADDLAQRGQRGMKIKLEKMIFNDGSTTTTNYGDSGTNFQSLVNALKHDDTYGGITRTLSSGTANYWQGADPEFNPATTAAGTSPGTSSQSTAYNFTIANLRNWLIQIGMHVDSMSDIEVYTSPVLFNKMKAEAEAKGVYEPGKNKMDVGFRDMTVDGYRIVQVPRLQTSATMKKWVFITNMAKWELRIHPQRDFMMTDFKHQAEVINGVDQYLARIFLAGNLVTWQPNASMFLSNVS